MSKKEIQLQQKKQKVQNALNRRDFTKAKKILKEICKKAPRDGQAWFLLSAVNGETGDFAGVITCCKRVLALDPRNVQALSNLGNAYAALQQPIEARQAYEKALRLEPKNPMVLHNLGNALVLDGAIKEAIKAFEDAIALKPDYAESYNCLGGAFDALGEYHKAVASFQVAIQLNPDLLGAHVSLGRQLALLGALGEAVDCYNKALSIYPGDENLCFGLALVRRYQGRHDEAMSIYREILENNPQNHMAIAGEAEIFEMKGQREEAYGKIRTLIEMGGMNGMGADVYLRICRSVGTCEEAISLAQMLLGGDLLMLSQKASVHNSLGKLYDKLADYDEAFLHFEQSNMLQDLSYDPATQEETVDNLISAFNPNTLAKIARGSNRSELPILILGMPRSGTTLVEQILASHPQVFGAGELDDINEIVNPLPKAIYPRHVGNMKQSTLDELAQAYLDRLHDYDPEAKRVTDKMPANFINLGLVAIMLPGARVIHCVRDPLDTCLSIYFQRFNLTHNYATDFANLGHFHKEYERLMAHWKSVLDIPILEVNYADMIADQEKVSREIVAFSGLEWDDRCLQFHKTGRDVATASYDQVRKPVYTSSLGRWKHYEKHLGPLKEALGI